MMYLELFSYTCYTISLRCMFICRKINDAEHYETLQEALDAYGITEFREPTYVPSGYLTLYVHMQKAPFVSILAFLQSR